MEIKQAEVQGEIGTGYEGPQKGLFQCSNCEYFRAGSCGQPTMMERSKLPKTENGRPIVSPEGCCEYIHRKGKSFKAGKRIFKRGDK